MQVSVKYHQKLQVELGIIEGRRSSEKSTNLPEGYVAGQMPPNTRR
jgi:hypothetical protein